MLDLLRDNAFLILLIAFGAFWLLMRTRASEVTSGSALDGIIGDGKPTIMEFFSNA